MSLLTDVQQLAVLLARKDEWTTKFADPTWKANFLAISAIDFNTTLQDPAVLNYNQYLMSWIADMTTINTFLNGVMAQLDADILALELTIKAQLP